MTEEKKTDVTAERLKSFVERIERLEESKSEIAGDIKDVYLELKSTGFQPVIVRQIVKLRKMGTNDRQEQEALLETYKSALGLS